MKGSYATVWWGVTRFRLPEKGNSNSHGARPAHLIISMIKWIQTSRLSMQNPSLFGVLRGWRSAGARPRAVLKKKDVPHSRRFHRATIRKIPSLVSQLSLENRQLTKQLAKIDNFQGGVDLRGWRSAGARQMAGLSLRGRRTPVRAFHHHISVRIRT